jgi:hypothetical protein
MSTEFIALEEYAGKTVDELWADVGEKFAEGTGRIELTRESKMVARLISPEEAHRQMARQIAEQWLGNKEAMERLSKSLDQEPEVW